MTHRQCLNCPRYIDDRDKPFCVHCLARILRVIFS